MSNVNLTIGGRRYTVASAAGEEAHVTELGRMIDTRVAALGGAAGQSETRMLLFAALMLADELHGHERALPAPIGPAPTGGDVLGERLEAIAAMLENLAGRLEASPPAD